jgi:hypothetical protein
MDLSSHRLGLELLRASASCAIFDISKGNKNSSDRGNVNDTTESFHPQTWRNICERTSICIQKKVQSSSVKRVHVQAVHTIVLSSQLELIDFTLSFE